MVNPILGSKVYLDASVLIYATEAPTLFPNLRSRLFEPLSRGELTVVTSWITLSEVLAKPLAIGDTNLEQVYRKVLMPTRYLEILAVEQVIASEAASLRAKFGLKLPDALHVATGIVAGCDYFLTGDAKWAKTGFPVIDAINV